MIDLRCGRWQDVLTDVPGCDVLLTDAPYSAKTVHGERGLRGRDGGARVRNGIRYAALTEADVFEFVAVWANRARHWAVIFGDDIAYQWWARAWRWAGWYVFAPVVWVKKNPPPRFSGDGPTCSAEHICVARPSRRLEQRRMGHRPGDYRVLAGHVGGASSAGLVGSKDLAGMRALVCDYSLPGDLIVDPFAGLGTTLLAADIEGRNCVGAERVASIHRRALMRMTAHAGKTTAA